MPGSPTSLLVLIPVFNDWRSLDQLLPRLAGAFSRHSSSFGVLLVDDASTEAPSPSLGREVITCGGWVRRLRLRRNLGHQRAIAIGMAYIDEHVPCDAVVVMDADGEDQPEDLETLLARYRDEGGTRIVFAERRRRAETPLFVLFYRLYQALHRVLTGAGVRVGNFSVIPRQQVSSLVVVSELWLHYAAAAMRSRQPWCGVETKRGRRLDGKSRMGFVALVVHGLSAIAVYSDVVFTRLVMGASAVAFVSLAAMAAVIAIRLLTDLAVPGWATYAVGLLSIVVLQSVMFAIALTFIMLGSRQQASVIPRRDYAYYVRDVVDLGPPHAS